MSKDLAYTPDTQAIPINVTMTQDSIILMSPLPHFESLGTSLRLEIRASEKGVDVQSELLGSTSESDLEIRTREAVASVRGNTDLVAIFKAVELALRR